MTSSPITFAASTTELNQLGDAELLKQIGWSPTAPKKLVDAAASGDTDAFLEVWQKVLKKRCRKSEAQRNLPPATSRNGNKERSREKECSRIDGLVDSILASGDKNEPVTMDDLRTVLEHCVNSKTSLARNRSFAVWRAALNASIHGASDRPQQSADAEELLLSKAEVGYFASLVFDAIAGAAEFGDECQRILSEALLESTDGDGTPHAKLLQNFESWFRPFVRASATAHRFSAKLWDEEAADRFESVVDMASRLCHPEGRLAFSNGESHHVIPLLGQAASVAGLEKSHAARQYLRDLESNPNSNGRHKRRPLFEEPPSNQSDWAHLACLRNDWSTQASSLTVRHNGEIPEFELSANGVTFFSGNWNAEIRLDGDPLEVKGDWECVCWFSDPDADYLELQVALESGIRLDRMFLLSRSDDFAVLGDVISGCGNRRVDYSGRFPLARGVQTKSAVPTRECLLKRGKQRVRAIPVGLPDDRIISTPGGFGPYESDIVLKQTSAGDGLFAPVVFDWSAARKRAPADWRQLTVAEDGRILPSGEAVGYRLRIDEHQLLLFRGLVRSNLSRTVLGHHTFYETVIGQFHPSGEVEPIVVVE